MGDKLKSHEVIGGLLGLCMEQVPNGIFPLVDRTSLYDCVRRICETKPEAVFAFRFRRRGGKWTSPEVDLTIRNLEDGKRLECKNPDLVNFQWTPVGNTEYENQIKPRLAQLGLESLFQEQAEELLRSSTPLCLA